MIFFNIWGHPFSHWALFVILRWLTDQHISLEVQTRNPNRKKSSEFHYDSNQHILLLAKGSEKNRNKFGLLPNWGSGWGSRKGNKKQTSILEKYFFSEHGESIKDPQNIIITFSYPAMPLQKLLM